MRELHPEMGVGDIAKELGKLWMSTDLQTKSKYMAIAEEDRARYERVRFSSWHPERVTLHEIYRNEITERKYLHDIFVMRRK